MEDKKICKIIEDLLPNYIEKMTTKKTNEFIEEHVEKCNECKNKLVNMQSDFVLEKVDEKEIDYLKKINIRSKRKILLVTILLIFILLFITLFIICNFNKREKQIKETYEDYIKNIEKQQLECYIEKQKFDILIFYDKDFKCIGTNISLKETDDVHNVEHYEKLSNIILQEKKDLREMVQEIINYCEENFGTCIELSK